MQIKHIWRLTFDATLKYQQLVPVFQEKFTLLMQSQKKHVELQEG